MGALICCAFERIRQWTDRKKRERTGMECPGILYLMQKDGFPIPRKKGTGSGLIYRKRTAAGGFFCGSLGKEKAAWPEFF